MCVLLKTWRMPREVRGCGIGQHVWGNPTVPQPCVAAVSAWIFVGFILCTVGCGEAPLSSALGRQATVSPGIPGCPLNDKSTGRAQDMVLTPFLFPVTAVNDGGRSTLRTREAGFSGKKHAKGLPLSASRDQIVQCELRSMGSVQNVHECRTVKQAECA